MSDRVCPVAPLIAFARINADIIAAEIPSLKRLSSMCFVFPSRSKVMLTSLKNESGCSGGWNNLLDDVAVKIRDFHISDRWLRVFLFPEHSLAPLKSSFPESSIRDRCG